MTTNNFTTFTTRSHKTGNVTFGQVFTYHWYNRFIKPRGLVRIGDIVKASGKSFWVTKLRGKIMYNKEVTYEFELIPVGAGSE